MIVMAIRSASLIIRSGVFMKILVLIIGIVVLYISCLFSNKNDDCCSDIACASDIISGEATVSLITLDDVSPEQPVVTGTTTPKTAKNFLNFITFSPP